MVARHLQNLPTASHQVQAQVLYHWLTFVNGFHVSDTLGTQWDSVLYSGSSGIINATTPSSLYDASPVFTASHLNKYVAVKDTLNPANCVVSRIMSVISPTRVLLDTNVVFGTDSVAVEYIIFDDSTPPAVDDYFVIQNSALTGPRWQTKITIGNSPAALSFVVGFIGGWDSGTSSWTLPVSSANWFPASVSRTFCVADDQAGYVFLWNETTPGGAPAGRNAVWFGSISPFHAPMELGIPKDSSYSAIFGSNSSPGPSSNLSRDTSVATSFVVGEMLDATMTPVTAYVAQKRLLSGTDMMTVPAAGVNPRSLQTDDYD